MGNHHRVYVDDTKRQATNFISTQENKYLVTNAFQTN